MENSKIQLIERKKRYLKRYKRNKACIERLEAKRDQLDEKITSVRSPNLSGMPRGGTPVTIDDLIADKIETEERIKRLKIRGQKLRSDILEAIDTLDNFNQVDVLEAFLIDGLTMEEISEKTDFHIRHVYRLYSEGVTLLALGELENDSK